MSQNKSNSSATVRGAVNILVHVIILFTFLATFFFVYISKVESAAFKAELGGMIRDKLNTFIDDNPTILAEIAPAKPVLDRMVQIYDKPMRSTLEHNITIKYMAAFTVISMICILLTILLVVSAECNESVGIGHILIENIVIFICIGIVEFMFFTKVAIKYIPVSPSTMVDTIIVTAKETVSKQ